MSVNCERGQPPLCASIPPLTRITDSTLTHLGIPNVWNLKPRRFRTSVSEANPKTRQMTLNAKKLTGFLRFSNELMSDIPNGENQILDICGKGLSWYRDKAFLKGSGAGEPLGILNSGCLLVQAKESGQAPATIQYQNLTGMLAKLHPACFKNSVWVCHQSAIPQLLELSIAVGTGGSHIPVMTEKNGGFSILTRPVIFTEKVEVLGSQGDILLGDFSQYVVGLREEFDGCYA